MIAAVRLFLYRYRVAPPPPLLLFPLLFLLLLLLLFAMLAPRLLSLGRPRLKPEAERVRLVTARPDLARLADASGYFAAFSPADAAANGCGGPGACRDAYVASLLTAVPADAVRRLRHDVALVDAACRRADTPVARLLLAVPWRVALLADRHPPQYPHTLGDVICLPAGFVGTAPGRAETLLHEKIHVFQRLYPRLCQRLFAAWGLTRLPASAPRPPGERRNPDLDGRLYADGDGVFTCQVYHTIPRGPPRSLAASGVACWTASGAATGGQPAHAACPGGLATAWEHPNERMAYQLAAAVMGDDDVFRRDPALAAWFRGP
jgi:hypothetical protein